MELWSRGLAWFPERGVGFLEVKAGFAPYDAAYFERYRKQAKTDIGRALMHCRVEMTKRYWRGPLVDVGIGSGAFIELRRNQMLETFGFDVNPVACDWLCDEGLFLDPRMMRPDAISLWDVMEHLPDFRSLLRNVKKYVFVSIPIFDGPEHALSSKHFRPDEHCWYFTREGLHRAFGREGFVCVEENNDETAIGREGIGSFVFERRPFLT